MDYISDNYADIAQTEKGQRLWSFMNRDDVVARLETATALNHPAIEGVAGLLLEQFGPEIQQQDRLKRMVGHMVKQVMVAKGYELESYNVTVKQDRRLFKKASQYKDGMAKAVEKGYLNKNNQFNLGCSINKQTQYNLSCYSLLCFDCGHEYLIKDGDIRDKQCPKCQKG